MLPTIYVPNYNGLRHLNPLLDSLRGQTTSAEVVVVDNGSTDGSTEYIRENYPEVNLLELHKNLGFGSALNRAIEVYPGDPVILLNSDVVCREDFVARMLEKADSGVEMVAGVLVSAGDPSAIDSAGVIADKTLMGFDYLHGEPLEAVRSALPPLGPTGAAALYRLEAFRAADGFDERIFLYYEDLDLALRLRSLGARSALASDAVAYHAYSQTLGANTAAKYAHTGWSRGYMLRRYGVMSRPQLAVRAAICEGVISAGQVIRDRSVAGILGRVQGWRAAGTSQRINLPNQALESMSLYQALGMRRRRRA